MDYIRWLVHKYVDGNNDEFIAYCVLAIFFSSWFMVLNTVIGIVMFSMLGIVYMPIIYVYISEACQKWLNKLHESYKKFEEETKP